MIFQQSILPIYSSHLLTFYHINAFALERRKSNLQGSLSTQFQSILAAVELRPPENSARTLFGQYRSAPGEGRLFHGSEKFIDVFIEVFICFIGGALLFGGASGGGTNVTREYPAVGWSASATLTAGCLNPAFLYPPPTVAYSCGR